VRLKRCLRSDRLQARLAVALILSLAATSAVFSAQAAEYGKVIVTAVNPRPAKLPTLGVWEYDGMTYVSATFPNLPDFTCDAWCYESALDFVDARPLDGGRIELRHRDRERPHVIIVTTVTPEPGAAELAARAELEKGATGALPDNVLTPNMCWQLKRAPAFASAPDPYPEFVKRCFIFTDKGRTFLDHTTRKKIPCRPADDPYNNPPWVQMYLVAGTPTPTVTPESWSDYSPDRYSVPVIGAVSRDGKYLAALANGSATLMAQAWHDCMHNNPPWLAANAPPTQRVWRVKVYAMKNDPGALLRRVERDFPGAVSRQVRTQ
jgi:hypothetical protein